MLVWQFSNINIYIRVHGKMPDQHFKVLLFSNPGEKVLIIVKSRGQIYAGSAKNYMWFDWELMIPKFSFASCSLKALLSKYFPKILVQKILYFQCLLWRSEMTRSWRSKETTHTAILFWQDCGQYIVTLKRINNTKDY